VYARKIYESYPQDIGLGESTPDANRVYREILNRQPDSSVVIVTVGYLTNLSKLLDTGPDDISPLSGLALIRRKVKHVVIMGGRYPLEQNPGKWGNFKPDPEAIRHVSKDWPTKIIFTTGGDFAHAIPTGKILFTPDAEPGNPITRAYRIFLDGKDRDYHHSADLIAVYVAVKGPDPFFRLRQQGYFHIFEDGTHMWRLMPDRVHHNIIGEFEDGVEGKQVAIEFDSLIVK
jgi:inosine-uridine nucleoside N-ribohydrolase